MRVRITKPIISRPINVELTVGDEFNVHPGINRFDIPVYEIADGPYTGIMLHKQNVEVIPSDIKQFLCLNCNHEFDEWVFIKFGHISKWVCPDCRKTRFLDDYEDRKAKTN